MEGMLAALMDGRLESPALDSVADLSDAMAMTSICGLGQAAPLPFTSLLRHFRPEVEAHLEGRCLTGAGGAPPARATRRRPAGPPRTV
jgi:NADH:ubiquinone oxidoreductase subunit F (NADH-binding)